MFPFGSTLTLPCFVCCVRGGIPPVENLYLAKKVEYSERSDRRAGSMGVYEPESWSDGRSSGEMWRSRRSWGLDGLR